MTLRSRIKALEAGRPDEDRDVRIVWLTFCRPHGEAVVERLAKAIIPGGRNGPCENVAREDGEAEDAFKARVVAAAQRIHRRPEEWHNKASVEHFGGITINVTDAYRDPE